MIQKMIIDPLTRKLTIINIEDFGICTIGGKTQIVDNQRTGVSSRNFIPKRRCCTCRNSDCNYRNG